MRDDVCMDTTKLLYSKREAAQLLSLSLRMIDLLIKRKQIAVRRVGKRVLITLGSLEAFAGSDSKPQRDR
jgi:excisionase family DNA binding protein